MHCYNINVINQLIINKTENLQKNLSDSNTVDSFIVANSNSFLSPLEILPIALGIFEEFSYFIMKTFVTKRKSYLYFFYFCCAHVV